MALVDDYVAQLPIWESTKNYLYLDTATPPNPTTAMGYLVASLAAMLAMPWLTATSQLADQTAVVQEWNRIRALPGGMVASRYYSPNGLHLSDTFISTLTRRLVLACIADLRNDFPSFDTMPSSCQMGVLDMRWNLGNKRLLGEYPHFDNAVRVGVWKAAAAECARNVKDPAFAKRNAWVAGLFEAAA